MAPSLMLGTHTLRGAVISTPDGDVREELWSDYASFLLAGPRGGPPDALRGRKLYRFRAEDMATDSPFWTPILLHDPSIQLPWWLHTAMGSHSDSSHKLHFRISTCGLSLVCFGRRCGDGRARLVSAP